jgi:hypothetical protein
MSFFVFPSIPTINPGDTISGSLTTTSGINPFFTAAFSDLYQLTLNSTTTVTIDMRSAAFTPRLYVASSSGLSLNSGVSDTGYSQITTTLSAGTYYIVSSSTVSAATGAYTISINVLPSFTSITPPFAAAGTSVPVTLTGTRFGVPMTVVAGTGAFSNLTVSNVVVGSDTSATASINVPAGTPSGTATVTVTTSGGSSNRVPFFVFSSIPSINVGDTVFGSLDGSHGNNPFNVTANADLYQLTLSTSSTITIDMSSPVFTPRVYLLSSSGASQTVAVNGAGDSQITMELQAGTYYILASSGAQGGYRLSVALKRIRGQITSQ